MDQRLKPGSQTDSLVVLLAPSSRWSSTAQTATFTADSRCFLQFFLSSGKKKYVSYFSDKDPGRAPSANNSKPVDLRRPLHLRLALTRGNYCSGAAGVLLLFAPLRSNATLSPDSAHLTDVTGPQGGQRQRKKIIMWD